MKKRLICFLSALALLTAALGGTALASAGSADDPLISLSYITDTFIPQVRAAWTELVSAAQEGTSDSEAALSSVVLPAGSTVTLGEGEYIVALSGRCCFTDISGSVVNVAVGAEAGVGGLNTYERYIVCEDSSVTVTAAEYSTAMVSAGAVTEINGSPFADVQPSDWFYDDVLAAVERGLVNGITPTAYEPYGGLTLAETIKLAACMHQLWYEGSVTLSNGEEQWYDSYVDYAYENDIISDDYTGLTAEEYNEAVTRAVFVVIFYAALPSREYTAINDIADGAIPDVSEDDSFCSEVYAFYRAGILTGHTADSGYEANAFAGDTGILRSEAAAIMNRMFDESARIEFSIE